MSSEVRGRRYRFGPFEADSVTGELTRNGVRVRIHSQPFAVLRLMLEGPGDLLTREEISGALWPGDTFVDFEHGVNSAVNRLRDALGDKASRPQYVETLSRRGYRFIAAVEVVEELPVIEPAAEEPGTASVVSHLPAASEPDRQAGWLTREEDLPRGAQPLARTLFVLLQVMYVGFYLGALANLAEIQELMEPLPHADAVFRVMLVSAAVLIPMRVYLGCAVLFRAPGFRRRFERLWPGVLFADLVWALSPFLLLHHMNAGAALACVAPLVYSPFAQRALVLMGAADQVSDEAGNGLRV